MSKFFQVIYFDKTDFPTSLGFYADLEEVEKVKGKKRQELVEQGYDEKRARLSVGHGVVSKEEMEFWKGL